MSAEPSLAIVDATVVTMDDRDRVLTGATIEVSGETISAVTDEGELAAAGRPGAARVIDAGGAIVMPGLVNAHAHLAMSMFRGLADDRDLDGFLARLLPAEGAVLASDSVRAATALAVAECLRAGITTVVDMYFFPEESLEVATAAGLHLHTGPVFVEFPGADGLRYGDRLDQAAKWLTAAADAGAPRWVCPHSTYLLDEEQLSAVATLADQHGARIHVHACETVAELDAVYARHRRTPIDVLADTGLLGGQTVLAHAVHLTDDEIGKIADSGASVTHCPASNQKLASGFARIGDLRAAGVTVALGTDGAASANDLDLFLAIRLAAYSQTALHGTGTLTAGDVLRMATIDGAHAAGVADTTGSIEVGKRADLIVLDATSPALNPCYDAVSTAAYSASRGDITAVVSAGRVVLDERRLTSIDVSRAIADVDALRPVIEAAVR